MKTRRGLTTVALLCLAVTLGASCGGKSDEENPFHSDGSAGHSGSGGAGAGSGGGGAGVAGTSSGGLGGSAQCPDNEHWTPSGCLTCIEAEEPVLKAVYAALAAARSCTANEDCTFKNISVGAFPMCFRRCSVPFAKDLEAALMTALQEIATGGYCVCDDTWECGPDAEALTAVCSNGQCDVLLPEIDAGADVEDAAESGAD